MDSHSSDSIWRLDLGTGRAAQLLATAAVEAGGKLSPDQEWMLYTFDEGGIRFEVYVRAYLDDRVGQQKFQVSQQGGEEAMWAPFPNGLRIVYRNHDQWYSVDATTIPEFPEPKLLFKGDYLNPPGFSYDYHPNTHRFLLIKGRDEPVTEIHHGEIKILP